MLALLALLATLVVPTGERSAQAGAAPPVKQSNTGQLNVVSINAAQSRILHKARFERLFELGHALRHRPVAFDGGAPRAVAAPDVILFQEMRFSNLEIFKRLLKQRYSYMYEIVGTEDASTKLLVNLDTVTPSGAQGTWDDVCLGGKDVGGRTYQWVGLTENATGAPVTVATVHFSNKYNQVEETECLPRNVEAMRAELRRATGTVVVGGDFNKRPMESLHECDPNEQSEPLAWYTAMTSASQLEAGFEDAVRTAQWRRGKTMADQWTFERHREQPTCRGELSHKRSRIDYLFVRGAVVGDASADAPGWAGTIPGTPHPTNFKYSDHRFVSARIVLSSIPRVARPTAEPAAGGVVHLAWNEVPGATGYVILRSMGKQPYAPIAAVTAADTAFSDYATRHGRSYRYSIAALATDGQGWESVPRWARADGRGPVVVGRTPSRGATRVRIFKPIEVRFDEKVEPSSVRQGSVRLFRRGNRIRARVTQIAPRVLRLTPARRLRKGTTYRVVVKGGTLRDVLGNTGSRDAWKFTTIR